MHIQNIKKGNYYFLLNDQKKVIKEKSPRRWKFAKIILTSLQENKLPPLARFKSGSSGNCRTQTDFPVTFRSNNFLTQFFRCGKFMITGIMFSPISLIFPNGNVLVFTVAFFCFRQVLRLYGILATLFRPFGAYKTLVFFPMDFVHRLNIAAPLGLIWTRSEELTRAVN